MAKLGERVDARMGQREVEMLEEVKEWLRDPKTGKKPTNAVVMREALKRMHREEKAKREVAPPPCYCNGAAKTIVHPRNSPGCNYYDPVLDGPRKVG